jgi:hypothetical protein
MSTVLEHTDEITIQELETELRAYEVFYGISTDLLLDWIESNDDRVEAIADAGFWRSSHELLCRLRQLPEQPEMIDEGPNGALALFSCQLA